ncbi:MAG: adenylate kinase family protein [Phycisphaerales bacterium]
MSEPTGSRYKSVLLFGAPGTGKGTQGALIGAVPGFFHHSSGDVFRSLSPMSAVGREFLAYSTKGELVPDDLTIRVWSENITAQRTVGRFRPDEQLLLLDGIPRNAPQAGLMDEHIEVLGIVHLTCDDPEPIFARLRERAAKQGRPDDAKEEVVRRRWSVYEEQTAPVLKHYPSSLVHKVDALGTVAEVLARTLSIVAPIQRDALGED